MFRMNTRRTTLFVCACLVLLFLAQPLGSVGAKHLETISPFIQHRSYSQPQPPKIRLQYASFDPLVGEPRVPPELQANETPAASGLHLVQFDGPLQAEWKRALESAGARLVAYIPDYAFICSLEGAALESVRSLAHVRWVGDYQPAYRLAESLREPALLKQSTTLSLVALLAPGADLPGFSRQVARLGGELVQPQAAVAAGFSRPQRLELPAAELDKLAALDEVLWVEPYASPVILNDIAGGEIMKANLARGRIGLYGNGQVVGIADTGLDTGSSGADMSDDFEGRIEAGQALCAPYGLRNEWSDLHGHGTHTTGSILGNGVYSGSNPAASHYLGSYAGVAPEARVVFQSIDSDGDGSLECVPGNLVEELFGPAYALGARVHSNSWGSGAGSSSELSGGYSTMTQAIDQAAWIYPDLLIVFAAGNGGTDSDSNGVIDLGSLLSTGSAKNHISVGASENDRPDITYTWQDGMGYRSEPFAGDAMADNPNGMAAFSSRGPTDDGRIKPDVVAPGTFVISARSHMPEAGTGWGLVGEHYNYFLGTSMATPLVSGAAAVVREWLIKLVGVSNPSAALVKALLLNGAVDPSPGQYGSGAFQEVPSQQPNPVSGWGRIDLESTLIPQGLRQVWLRDDAVGLATGEYQSYEIELGKFLAEEPGNAPLQAELGGPFRLTLVWTDYPGTPGAASFLVNDLDLEVIAPDGTKYTGNAGIYSSGPCLRGGAWDACNNVETVLIPQALNGAYTIRVYGINVPYGPQKFALAGYGDCVNTACQPFDQFTYLPVLSHGH
jgi:subtilisin family serine protease